MNGGVDDSPEANGAEPGDSNGTTSKKKKSQGMCLQPLCVCPQALNICACTGHL